MPASKKRAEMQVHLWRSTHGIVVGLAVKIVEACARDAQKCTLYTERYVGSRCAPRSTTGANNRHMQACTHGRHTYAKGAHFSLQQLKLRAHVSIRCGEIDGLDCTILTLTVGGQCHLFGCEV